MLGFPYEEAFKNDLSLAETMTKPNTKSTKNKTSLTNTQSNYPKLT